MNRRTHDHLLLVRIAADQVRAAVLAAAADPAEPALARVAHRDQVEAATARLSRLVRWRPRRHWRTAAIVRRWLNNAVMAHFYRLEPYRPAEQALWAAIAKLPDTPVSAADRRRLREQLEDAQVLADYARRDQRAEVTRAAAAYNTARRRGAGRPLAAALAGLAAPPPVAHTDPTRRPALSQAELLDRVYRDQQAIRLEATLGGEARFRSAERQLMPWLKQLADTLDRPLSAAAVELACEQWWERRAPYFFTRR